MSLSKEERLQNLASALKLMLQELGNNPIDGVRFEMDSETFRDVEETTWRQLEENYWTEREQMFGGRFCRFTGAGWRTAIELIWKANEAMLNEVLSKISAALKDSVKGRHEDAYVYLDSLVAETELPEYLVFNVIESDLIGYKFNIKSAYFDPHRGKGLIHVPLDYGLRPI